MRTFIASFFILLSVAAKAQNPNSLDAAKRLARYTNKLLLLDFTASWCGPCKMMEAQFWSKEEYKNITNSFVIVKIDIDEDKSTALFYGVNSIPNVKIVNAEGEELYGFLGYESAEDTEKRLAGFPSSVGGLYEAMEYEKKGNPTAEECLFVAANYQAISQQASGAGKEVMLKQSNDYFKKCKKSNPPDTIALRADLGRAFNYVIDNAPQKAIKEIDIEKIDAGNKPFALFILARASLEMKDKVNMEKYLIMLEALHTEYWQTATAALRKEL